MDLSFDCQSAYVSANNSKLVTVEISGVQERDLLNQIDVDTAASHYDHEDLLDIIGSEKAKKYFDLIDNNPDA